MNLDYFLKDSHLKFPKDSHGLFPASNYHWLNYSIERMMEVVSKRTAAEKGTKLHSLACMLIEEKQPLPEVEKTLNMYVNDAIYYGLYPEKQLYFSDEFRGTADAIGVDSDGILRIFDLKTGTTKASLKQLYIYVALFCLDAKIKPSDFSRIETRIYQNNEIVFGEPTVEDVVPIMDKMKIVNELIKKVRGL